MKHHPRGRTYRSIITQSLTSILPALTFAAVTWLSPMAKAVESQYVTSNLLSRANGSYSTWDDQSSAFIPIGFNFTFGGVEYSNFSMSINGILFFANASGQYTNYPLAEVSNFTGVFALWDDLYLGDGYNENLTRLLYYTTGEPGSRKFIAQWTNAYSYGEIYEVGTFNVVLYEGSNKIDIYYRNMLGVSEYRAYGKSATVGLRTAAGDINQYSYDTPVITEGKLLTYTPSEGGNAPYTLTEQLVTPATTAAIPTYYLTHVGNPKVPVNLSAAPSTPNNNSATVSWDLTELGAVPSRFRVRYADNPELTGVFETADIDDEDRSFTINGLTPGVTYYYQIVSYETTASSNSTVSSFTQIPNVAPVANNGSATTFLGVAHDGTLTATDEDNEPTNSGLIYSIVANGAHGTAEITNSATGGFRYTPNPGHIGTDSFTFKAFDGTAYSNEATVTVVTIADLAGPLAVNDTVTSTIGTTRLYPLANDGDPAALIVAVTNPLVTIAPDGRSVIVPEGFSGQFDYYAVGGETVAKATINVIAGTPLDTPRKFTGLLYDVTGKPTGFSTVTISTKGSATAQVRLGTTSASSKFAFATTATTATGVTTLGDVTITRNANGTLDVVLARLGGNLGGNLRAAPLATTPVKYHVALASIDPSITGGGFLIANVRRSSTTSVTGLLPDGRPFSSGSSVADNGTISFYGKQTSGVNPPGLMLGQLIAANLPTTDVTGEVYWNKPAQGPGAKGTHRDGVNTVLTGNGSIYNGVIPFNGPGVLTFSGSNFTAPVTVNANVTAGIPTVPTLPLKGWAGVRATVGKFSPRVIIPGSTRPVAGNGVFLPKSQKAWGYFPGTTRGGRIELSIPPVID